MISIRQRLLNTSMITGAALVALAGAPAYAQVTAPTETVPQAQVGEPVQTDEGVTRGEDQQADELQGVTVTGSRIVRQDYTANSPIVTVGRDNLEQTGAVTVDALLNELPQFSPAIGSGSNNPSNQGQANVALRGLGTNRTLVLIDGRRVTPSNSTGVVDLNVIPNALIENIEIITGGASAVYGSDAIAGVVNFRLRNNFRGVELDLQYGQTERNDGESYSIGVTAGSDFAEGKGNAVMSVSFSARDAVFAGERNFSAIAFGITQNNLTPSGSGTVPEGAYNPALTNLPTCASAQAVFASYGTPFPANLCTAVTAANPISRFTPALGFNQDNSVFLFTPALNYRNPQLLGFDPASYSYNFSPANAIQLPLERYSIFNRLEYELRPNLELFSQFIFTNYRSGNTLATSPASGPTGFLVPVTNPNIPADLRTILATRPNPTAAFNFGFRPLDIGPRFAETTNNVWQLLGGLRGEVPEIDGSYEVYTAYGRLDTVTNQTGNIQRSAVQRLLDAPTGGNATGCTSFDPFGSNQLTPACVAAISPQTKNQEVLTQRVTEATVQGGLANYGVRLPAGDIRFALGLQYRSDEYEFRPDALLSAPAQPPLTGFDVAGFNASPPLTGQVEVYEFFGETLLPVLANLPFVQNFDVTLGYRYSDYNTIGGVQSYKAELDWGIIEPVRFRASYQRAVRAPNISELFSAQTINFPSVGAPAASGTGGDPCDIRSGFRLGGVAGVDPARVRALCIAQGIPAGVIDSFQFTNQQVVGISGGNPELTEEVADTKTAGLVLRSPFQGALLSRLTASIDYYNIEIQEAVSSIGVGVFIPRCFNAQAGNPTYDPAAFFCSFFNRNESGQIINAAELSRNIGTVITSGVDFQVDYRLELADIGAPGWAPRLDVNFIANYLDEYLISLLPNDPFRDIKGTIGPGSGGQATFLRAFPEWKTVLSITAGFEPVSLTLRHRFISEMDNNSEATITGLVESPTLRDARATHYLDLLGRWSVTDAVDIRFGINNLNDQQPRIYSQAQQSNTDPNTYDVLGRRYFIGLRAKF
jgi:outer membrane receptor protein involved in Fe transport